MPKSDNQKLKIFYILDYLQRNSHQDHPVRASELLSMLERRFLQDESDANRQKGIALANSICRNHRREGSFFDEILDGAKET